MTWGDAVYVVRRAARALGCRVGLHDWYFWADSDEWELLVEHRECRIAACQVHQVWVPEARGWVEASGGSFL